MCQNQKSKSKSKIKIKSKIKSEIKSKSKKQNQFPPEDNAGGEGLSVQWETWSPRSTVLCPTEDGLTVENCRAFEASNLKLTFNT